jgi:hypothetical protein
MIRLPTRSLFPLRRLLAPVLLLVVFSSVLVGALGQQPKKTSTLEDARVYH